MRYYRDRGASESAEPAKSVRERAPLDLHRCDQRATQHPGNRPPHNGWCQQRIVKRCRSSRLMHRRACRHSKPQRNSTEEGRDNAGRGCADHEPLDSLACVRRTLTQCSRRKRHYCCLQRLSNASADEQEGRVGEKVLICRTPGAERRSDDERQEEAGTFRERANRREPRDA